MEMDPRPTRRLRCSPPPPPQHGAGDPEGDDRITALPDDMLLQVLVRLRCARAAARTGLLSRRWRGLWARLPGLTFRDISAGEIKSALAHFARRTAVSRLEIRLISSAEGKLDDASAKSLLLSAVRFSPEEIVFVLPTPPQYTAATKRGRAVTMVLPCFHRATSIELDTQFLRVVLPPAGELPMLETLSISGHIVNLAALLNRCPRLRVLRITFRGVEPVSLETELTALEAAAALGLTVSGLGIELNNIDRRHTVHRTRLASLLRVMAKISPRELLFTRRIPCYFDEHLDAVLPCFQSTTSIEINLHESRFIQLSPGEFSALETLALKYCTITDLITMIIRCPRLRVLKVTIDKYDRDIMVHSASLQHLELDVHRDTDCRSINIVAPLLKQLKLSVHGNTNIDVSISVPMVEQVSWWHTYTLLPFIFGFWSLKSMRFSYRHRDEEGLCSHLPHVHVLSMHISSYNPNLGVTVDLAHEMEKLMVTNFSVFELYLDAKGHVFGALVLQLLKMHHIRTSTQKLKVLLPWGCQESKCLGNCPCDEPKNWRSQSISLICLEEVEISNFRGRDHEIDFVRLIFGWAPMLTRMIIRLAYDIKQSEVGGCASTIYNICLAYPSVNCVVYLRSGEKWSCPSGLRLFGHYLPIVLH